jgi:hypothetical protein
MRKANPKQCPLESKEFVNDVFLGSYQLSEEQLMKLDKEFTEVKITKDLFKETRISLESVLKDKGYGGLIKKGNYIHAFPTKF